MTESEVKDSKLQLPPAQVCSGGIERIKEFFFHPEQKDLEHVALSILSLLDSSSATVAPVVVGVIDTLWKQGQEHAPFMAQQLWVSLVSHKSSNENTLHKAQSRACAHHATHQEAMMQSMQHPKCEGRGCLTRSRVVGRENATGAAAARLRRSASTGYGSYRCS